MTETRDQAIKRRKKSAITQANREKRIEKYGGRMRKYRSAKTNGDIDTGLDKLMEIRDPQREYTFSEMAEYCNCDRRSLQYIANIAIGKLKKFKGLGEYCE